MGRQSRFIDPPQTGRRPGLPDGGGRGVGTIKRTGNKGYRKSSGMP